MAGRISRWKSLDSVQMSALRTGSDAPETPPTRTAGGAEPAPEKGTPLLRDFGKKRAPGPSVPLAAFNEPTRPLPKWLGSKSFPILSLRDKLLRASHLQMAVKYNQLAPRSHSLTSETCNCHNEINIEMIMTT